MRGPHHLRIDPARRGYAGPRSGLFAPAIDENGHTETAAIEELDSASLLVWLRSRATRTFVEDVVGLLLGHGYLNGRDAATGRYPADVPPLATTEDVEHSQHILVDQTRLVPKEE